MTTPSPELFDENHPEAIAQRARGKKQFKIFIYIFLFFAITATVFQMTIIINRRLQMTGDGKNVDSYKFDLSNLTVPRKYLVASGVSKDGQRVLDHPIDTISMSKVKELNEKSKLHPKRFVVSDEKVIGVTLNGQSRAYLLQQMRWHEIINDVVGDTPIAVTYNELTDSVVVFDRRVNNKTIEFGYSGLLYNSNLLMYDRHPEREKQSLWSQLLFKPISGPAVTQNLKLKVLPVAYTTWGEWSTQHPDTDVMRGIDNMRKDFYKKNPMENYFKEKKLRFPVAPLPSKTHSPEALFTPIVAWESDNNIWMSQLLEEDRPKPNIPPGVPVVYSRYFAWYAFTNQQQLKKTSTDQAEAD